MKKRYITIPEPVSVISLEDDETVMKETPEKELRITFLWFIRSRMGDEGFGTNLDHLESALSIRMGIRGKAPGDVWEVDEDDWEILCAVIRNPKVPYNPGIAMALVPFMRIVIDAKNEKPAALKDAAE